MNSEESLTCVPEIFTKIKADDSERFPCPTCGKSYLRRRHLQRHMRDECIGIPPRFHCEMCPSKFRRKYHLVRHLSSKHGIITPPTPMPIKSEKAVKKEINITENREINNLLLNNFDKFSVEALMMKQDNLPVISSVLGGQDPVAFPENYNGDMTFAQLGLQQTFQNLKNLFISFAVFVIESLVHKTIDQFTKHFTAN
ncbi:CLUMA_CG002584, isoform A [Clunio marinus]|uniref:CLUMA_CG002584, isoform A n=1 Tax=Clunio marinus TaxID=568069 RepID=A0A1J1HM16_9DIPT|nr:CLUMA_CG002584, isoform A [Clunio marinus]